MTEWSLAVFEGDQRRCLIGRVGALTTLGDGTPFFEWAEAEWSRIKAAGKPGADSPNLEDRLTGPQVWIRFEVSQGRPEIAAVRVERRLGEPEVSPTALSRIPWQRIADSLIGDLAGLAVTARKLNDGEDVPKGATTAAGEAAVAIRRRRTVTDELLQEVAAVYLADTTGKPTKAVAAHFPTSHRNATRYVAMARERNFLPEYGEDQQ